MIGHSRWMMVVMGCLCLASGASFAKPEWAGNRLGLEALQPDYTDPGVRPFRVSGNLVMVWQKRMSFGPLALPETIAFRDYRILRKPARLEVMMKTGKVKFPAVRSKLLRQGKTQVLATSDFTAGGLKYSVKAQLEFDFTVKYQITVAPEKNPVTVDSMTLIFPMGTKAAEEKLVMYQQEGPNRPLSGVQAQKRRAFRTIKGGDRTLVSPGFCPMFWVGTTYWGLSWNFESARSWEPVKGRELVYDPRSGEMRLNFIGRKFTVSSPLTYTFYLCPTPVRPMPKNWRAWNYGWRGNVQQNMKNYPVNQLIYWSSICRSVCFNSQWIRDAEGLRKAAVQDGAMHKANYYIPSIIATAAYWKDKNGHVFYREDPYLDELCRKYIHKPSAAPRKLEIPADATIIRNNAEYDRLIGRAIPEIAGKFGGKWEGVTRNYVVAPAPEIADHMVYALSEFIRLGVGGIYYDGVNPGHNYADWTAWKDSDGQKRPVFHYEWMRQLLKRMRAVVKKNDPEEIIIAHMSGSRPMATLTMCDAILPGETFFYWYHEAEKRDFSPTGEFYYASIVGDIDNLKGEFFHRQWGMPIILLPEIRGKDGRVFKNSRGTRTMLSYTLHFDTLYFPSMCHVSELYKIYGYRNRYGMSDTDQYVVEFTPYWENRMFRSEDENIKISYYDHVKQQELYTSFDTTRDFMVIVSNLQFVDHDFKMSLPKELKNAKVQEMQSRRSLKIENGKISDSLKAYDFAIYRITGEISREGSSW